MIGVSVTPSGPKVGHWCQPKNAPHGKGVVALLTGEIDGVLHALVHARVDPEFVDVIELAPTVQCTPESYDILPPAGQLHFLDYVLAAPPEWILFDTELSEEGGRPYRAPSTDMSSLTPVDEVPDHPQLPVDNPAPAVRTLAAQLLRQHPGPHADRLPA